MGREDMRAGDADRQAVADTLKAALDEGRLDLHEYDERLQQAYAAKTYGELETLITDLPGVVPAQHSQLQPQPAGQQPASTRDAGSGAGKMRKSGVPPWVASYGGVILICVVVWGISSIASGDLQYFWPRWMLIPLLFGVLGWFRRRDR
jgi:hypothetical protein